MSAYVEALKAVATLDNRQWNRAIADMTKGTKGFQRSVLVGMKSVGGSFLAIGSAVKTALKYTAAGATAVAVTTAAIMKHHTNAANEMEDMSFRTGMAVDQLSRLKYAAEQSGASLEDVTTGMKGLANTAYDAYEAIKKGGNVTNAAALAYKALGVKVTDGNGHLKTQYELMMNVADALTRVKDRTRAMALAQDVLGKQGGNLMPFLMQGRGGIQAAMDEANRRTYIWSEGTVAAAEKMRKAWGSLSSIVWKQVDKFAEGLTPSLTSIAERMGQWYDKNEALISSKAVEWGTQYGQALENIANWAVKLNGTDLATWFSNVEKSALKSSETLQDLCSIFDFIFRRINPFYGYSAALAMGINAEEEWRRPKEVSFRDEVPNRRNREEASPWQTLASGGPTTGPQTNNYTVINSGLAGSMTKEQVVAMAEILKTMIDRGVVAPLGGE
jgi:hypothetical protein